MIGAVVRSAIAALAAALWVASGRAAPPPHAADEIRALWVVRTTLTSAQAVDTMVARAKAGGFNTLLVQIRGRGDAYYLGGLEPRPPALAAQPAFDPLAETIARGHDAGLQVHAWININLVGGLDLPSSRDHVVHRHPEWVMVPRALAQELARVKSGSPEYLGRLARYARGRSNDVEGLYLSPVPPRAAEYTAAVVRDIAARYPVDGVHLDYVRYPQDDFDYGSETLAAFQRDLFAELPAADRARYDRRLRADPLVLTYAFPERWRTFRVHRMTALVTRLREAIRDVRPDAVVSAAVAPDAAVALAHRLQDWRTWIAQDLIDVVCPMAYTTEPSTFAAQIGAAREAASPRPVWAGIGAYRLTAPQIADAVQAARRLGAGGTILFSYDSLADPAHGPDFLMRVGRAAFTQ